MQKFTRALTREIEVGGERLAVTLSEEGLSVRPVGARRPPHTLSWAACVCASTGHPPAGPEPSADELAAAVKALKSGGASRPAAHQAESAAPATQAEPAAAHAHAATAGEQHAPPPLPQTGAERSTPAPAGQGLAALLGRIDHWLAKHRPHVHRALLPGASAADLDALQSALGGKLPDELRTWLSWHNGQDADGLGAFVDSWYLMSARQIVEAKKELDAEGHPGWQRSWVPFLDDDESDYLCLDAGQAGCPVRECWSGQPDHPAVAPSLQAWAEQFVTGLEQGAYHEDPERGTFQRA
jgi:cell wall assembly regulator SMI1